MRIHAEASPGPTGLRLLAGGAALGALACLVAAPPAAVGSAPPAPDVLLVTLDTTRADFLGCYGDGRGLTPTLDALAARGLRYERAVTPSPLTLPAHASLLTGLAPPDHGLRDNGAGELPQGVPTLASILAGRGYATAAFVASRVLDRRFGLNRGFSTYDDDMVAEHLGEYGYPERDAEAVTDAALSWLGDGDRESGRPFFLWVHYYDPHAPYEAPGAVASSDPRRRYAGEIAYVDRELARLLAGIDGAARTVVAVVGDHGESLGEHGENGHGIFLYEPSLAVPLILAGPGVPRGETVAATVSSRRLAPTLLALAIDPSAARRLGAPLPGLGGGHGREEPPGVYSEALLPATAYGWAPLKAVTAEGWRLIVAPRPELYDLARDPGETENLLSERGREARRLRDALAHLEAEMESRGPPSASPHPEIASALRSLGYLSGQSRGEIRFGEGIDPKDGIGWLEELEEAKRRLDRGQIGPALKTLRSLAERNPENVPFLTHLARAQGAGGDPGTAIATLRRAVELNPGLDVLHANLGDAHLAVGDLAEARRAYARAVELNPRLARAWLGLGEAALREDRPEEERRILRRAVEAGTGSVAVLTRLAQLAAERDEDGDAERYLREATERDPEWAPAWLVWGDLLERRGAYGEAAARYLHAVQAAPGDPVSLLRAGGSLLRAGRTAEGRALLQRVLAVARGTAAAREAASLLEALRTER